MGSYATLYVDGYPVVQTKNHVLPELMTAFRESDRGTLLLQSNGEDSVSWTEELPPWSDDHVLSDVYHSRAWKVAQRLDVMGFTLDRARRDYEETRDSEMAGVIEYYEDDEIARDNELSKWRSLNFDAYFVGLRTVLSLGLTPWFVAEEKMDERAPNLDVVEEHILDWDGDYLLGYLGDDFRGLLRLVCEIVDDEARVVQDITDLIQGGWLEPHDSVCEQAVESLLERYPENASRIVLTEGSTDAMYLSSALKLLHPHLAEYYAFFDFHSFSSRGGTAHLATAIRAFAAAGIANRIVALFDNDGVGLDEMERLSKTALPPNIAVFSYPDYDALKAYPVREEGECIHQNVNGIAASIELYMGDDVLRSGGGEPFPVACITSNGGRPHGSISASAKRAVKKAYGAKLRSATRSGDLSYGDWSGLEAILQSVFHAFDE